MSLDEEADVLSGKYFAALIRYADAMSAITNGPRGVALRSILRVSLEGVDMLTIMDADEMDRLADEHMAGFKS